MKIYLIRHGQTTSDVEDRFGGDYDDHLTELGIAQANELAEKLKNKGIEVIFASNLIRAQETAKILNNKINVEVKLDPGLRERNANGPLTGMIRSEARNKYPELVERLKDAHDTIEGAEDFKQFVERIVNTVNKLAKTNYKTIAIIAHGGPIRRVMYEMLGVREESEIKIDDCAYLEIESGSEGNRVVSMTGIQIV